MEFYISQPKNVQEKIEYVFTKIPIKYNHFASLILLSRYINEDCFPLYLKKENLLQKSSMCMRIQGIWPKMLIIWNMTFII